MGALLIFIYKSAVVMLAIFAIYKLLLARAGRPRFCRFVLLVTYALAPLAVWLSGLDFGAAAPLPSDIGRGVNFEAVAIAAPEPAVWPRVLLWVWLCGVGLTGTFMLLSVARVGRLVAGCRRVRNIGRARLAVTDDRQVAPFSFGRTMVVNSDDLASDGPMIIAHELQHIALWHSADLMLARIAAVIMWFNPAAWLLVRELSKVHEFEVDGRVIRAGVDIRRYQYMLIGRAVGYNQAMMVNGLNHSSIRQRIMMMQYPEAATASRWRALSVLPVALAATIITARQPFLAELADATLGRGTVPESVEINYAEQPGDIDETYLAPAESRAAESMPEIQPVVAQTPKRKAEEVRPAAEPAVQSEPAAPAESVPAAEPVAPQETVSAPSSAATAASAPTNVTYTGRARTVRKAGSVSTPFYYIDGDPYERLPKNLDQSKIESITVRRDVPGYPDGVIYITMKHE